MSVPTAVIDLPLDDIATCTAVHYCSAEPANHSGIAAVTLGTKSITGSDFTKAAGDTSGRKLTFGAQTAIAPTGNGTVTFAAFTNGSVLKKTVPMTSQAVTTGQSWQHGAIKLWEIRIPTYS